MPWPYTRKGGRLISRIFTAAINGIDSVRVEVQVDITYGLPSFNIVGLPETAVKESRERVRAAVKNAGFEFPSNRITINLAPADLRKEGSSFDLPIAIGILTCMGIIKDEGIDDYLFAGELSLDGNLKAITGILPMALLATREGIRNIIVPSDNIYEASVVKKLSVYGARHLLDIVSFF
jgi:magnesium chelatase family protein